MRPTRVRRRYAIAKAKMLRRALNLTGPPVPVEDVITSHGIIIKYELELQEPVIVKYGDKYIIFTAPIANENFDRLTLIKSFAHMYLEHFELYAVNKIIFDYPVELLTESEIFLLEQEAQVFAEEFLVPEEWLREAVQCPLTAEHFDYLRNTFKVPGEIILKRLKELKFFE